MLVYANHLSFQGADAEEAIFKAIGGWLKEQMGYGLHPNQLKEDGEFTGNRGGAQVWLRIYSTSEESPELYAWVLKVSDDRVRGRQWITEVGVKTFKDTLELSCVLKTDEQSTLVDEPVTASRPRLIRYVHTNIQQARDAIFASSVPGVSVKTIGQTLDSYRGLLTEIERQGRNHPIVLVSPTRDGEFLLNTRHLQEDLFGLAQVVEITPDYNSYDMEEILGRHWSAWGGAVNVLHIPARTGFVRGRLFMPEDIEGWGDTQNVRISQLLAWVTNNTNVPLIRKRIRPEGVMQLALRRRLQTVRAKSDRMDADQLRNELERASHAAEEQAEWIRVLEDENSRLESDDSEIRNELDDSRREIARKRFEIQSVKDQLNNAGEGKGGTLDAENILGLACRVDSPSPLECLEAIERVYGNKCCILDSAKDSARNMGRFIHGRQLLDMLKRLVTEYRSGLIQGGDNKARHVFGRNEYAATESETVTSNKTMRRARTFVYRGMPLEMFRHLKIGVDDDATKTIRVHFFWDNARKIIVVGYCGEHLPVASH